MTPWIGVDLDGTLAEYHGWTGDGSIGAPIPAMVERVKGWLAEGKDVRIFTARVSDDDPMTTFRIREWCVQHVGCALPITNVKDYGMVELWDDRAVQVLPNTGESLQSYVVTAASAIKSLAVDGYTPKYGDVLRLLNEAVRIAQRLVWLVHG